MLFFFVYRILSERMLYPYGGIIMGLFGNIAKSFRLGGTPLMSHHESTEQLDLSKSYRSQESKAVIEDPMSIVNSLGYKDKPFSISYDTLKKMAIRNSVVAAVISTRVNQVSTFSQPARFTKDGVGYQITLRDPKKSPTKQQKNLMMALELFIENMGFEYDPSRDSFDTFLRKIVRDSMTFDQLCFEIVPDRMGRPAEIYAVDASTIRAAAIEPDPNEEFLTATSINSSSQHWVQVVNGRVESSFNSSELAFAVRNPRTDINIAPYGFSELEILIHQVTAHLWAEEYNSRYFSQGGTTKGILNLKGQNISKDQLDAFRRQWTAQVSGLTGAWKTPVVSVEGLEYLNVSQSNREMEYEQWVNYLINIVSAVYQIDPAEINFPNRGGAGGSGGGGLGEGGVEERLKNSRDKGLRPLLRFLESVINKHLVYKFSRDFTFSFIGLDQESEAEKAALNEKLVRTRKTINEIRAENDQPPIEGGDIILDPTYTNYLLQKQQNDMMAQQQQGAGGDPNQGDEQELEQQDPEEAQQQQQDQQISQGLDDKYGDTQSR